MTENENLDQDERDVSRDTRTRGGGALIGRFLAVGLFVVLGTVAVVQSLGVIDPVPDEVVKKENSDPNSIQPVSGEGKLDLSDIKPVKNDPKSDPKIIKSPVPSRSTFSNPIANNTPKTPLPNPRSTGGTFSKTLKPATTNPLKPAIVNPVVVAPKQTGGGTFGGGTFGGTGSGNSATVSTKPKTPPPNRIAQLNTGSARSTFGIGGPAAKPAATLGGVADDLKKKAEATVDNAAGRLNQFGKDAKDTAASLTNRTKAAFGQAKPSLPAPKKLTEPVVATSPFKQQGTNTLPKVEAKSALSSPSQQRPFSGGQASSGGFKSQSLNPISKTSTGPTRAPSSSVVRQPNPFPPSRPVSRQTSSTTVAPRGQTSGSASSVNPFPPRNETKSGSSLSSPTRRPLTSAAPAKLPSATSRPPMRQASRVSSKPGDRQYEGVQSPSMIIQKFSPREIQVNQTADFEIKIRNVGRVSVDDVLVVDQIPEGARFIDANPKPTSQSRTGELNWQLGTMNPGQERTILLQLQPTEPGEIGSVAQFYFGSRATNRTKVTQPKLKITHTADPKVLIGNNVIFDVVVENTGNGPARDVVIQEEVPELLEYQDGSRELEYEVGTLLPGQSRRVQLGLRAARVGRLKNVMFASAKGGLQSKHEANVEIIAPKLTTSSEGPTRRYIKRKVTHTFTVGNSGTAAATNLRLIARLPSGLRFVDANNRGRYDRNSHSVVWQMRDLAAGGSGNVEVATTPVEAGEQNIKFEAAADLNQRSETVQNLNVEHLVDVFFDIDDVVDPIEIGAETRYRIRVVNQGTQAASNVKLQVDFPTGLQPTSVDGDLRNQIRGQQILFEPISSLRPGEELDISVVASGRAAGDHRIVVNMTADGRDTPVSKQETTRVYADR